MDEPSVEATSQENISFWRMHSYIVLVILSIGLALAMVSVSLYLYTSSGAEQLDLSRPGFIKISSQVNDQTKDSQAFSSSGDISSGVIDDFTKLFNAQSTNATQIDAFSSDPLNPDALQISAPTN